MLKRDMTIADFDPEFDAASVAVSRNLANEYRKIALQNHAAFLNASDFAAPSVTDREHMDEKGHAAPAGCRPLCGK